MGFSAGASWPAQNRSATPGLFLVLLQILFDPLQVAGIRLRRGIVRHPLAECRAKITTNRPVDLEELHIRRIDQLHRSLGKLEHELTQSADNSRFAEYQTRIDEIEFCRAVAQGRTPI